ncbi:MAG: hypothetical protein LBL23_06670 [Coriobacteriales bacterium]|jgi:hypothetical protein|nr:hypothetical protein [Coriobacteriales bacterium]
MRQSEVIEKAEEYIIRTGDYGLRPLKSDEMKSLTGLKYVPAIEKRIGRRITGAEWESMSIR